MTIARNAVRSFFSNKTQAVLAVLLVVLGAFLFTVFAESNEVMSRSVLEYDNSQNVEDYSFIPRLNFTQSDWHRIYEDYNILISRTM